MLDVVVGTKYYHRDYGTVEVLAVKERPEGKLYTIKTYKGEVTVLNKEGTFLELGSVEAEAALQKVVRRKYNRIPLVAAISYFIRYRDRYNNIFRELLPEKDKSGSAFDRIKKMCRNYLQSVGDLSNNVRDDRAEDGWALVEDVVKKIYERTGDDLSLLGLVAFSDNPKFYAQNLIPELFRAEAHNRYGEKGRGGVRTSALRDDVLEFFTRDRLSHGIANKYSPEERARFQTMFAAGDYDVDRDLYNRLRNADAEAIGFWAAKMAAVIQGDPALAGADLMIPVIGREHVGWPNAQLAKEIAAYVDKPILQVFEPRPKKREEAESGLSVRKKADQSERIYKLKDGTADHVKGKTIIVIDDNITTGETARAVAGKLRELGTAQVYVVAATKTNRIQDSLSANSEEPIVK